MKKSIELSVLMTAFNRQAFIAEAIESVLNSSYKDFEFIIVDDDSSDDTFSIIETYARQDARIKPFRNSSNLGDYPNRNCAISKASGEYIMFVDSDDKIFVDGFERCLHAMRQFPNASFGMQYDLDFSEIRYIDGPTAIKKHFFKKPFLVIGPGGTIIKREFMCKIGMYPVNYGPANDMYFNLVATSKVGVLLLPFRFNDYRIHDGQEQNNTFKYIYNNFRYNKDVVLNLGDVLTKNEVAHLNKRNGRQFLVNLLADFREHGNIKRLSEIFRLSGFEITDLKRVFNLPFGK